MASHQLKVGINMHLAKAWTAIDFFQAAVVSIQLYGCWQNVSKKLYKNGKNYNEQILEATTHEQQLYSHLPPIYKIIQIRQAKHAGPCWKSKNELIQVVCDVLLWTPPHERANVGRPTRTYLQQLCADTGCSLEELPGAMHSRNRW